MQLSYELIILHILNLYGLLISAFKYLNNTFEISDFELENFLATNRLQNHSLRVCN